MTRILCKTMVVMVMASLMDISSSKDNDPELASILPTFVPLIKRFMRLIIVNLKCLFLNVNGLTT